ERAADDGVHSGAIQRIGLDAEGLAARLSDLRGEAIERALFHVYGHHGAALARDDARRRPSDSRAGCRDQRHLSRKSHRTLSRSSAMKALSPRALTPCARALAALRSGNGPTRTRASAMPADAGSMITAQLSDTAAPVSWSEAISRIAEARFVKAPICTQYEATGRS